MASAQWFASLQNAIGSEVNPRFFMGIAVFCAKPQIASLYVLILSAKHWGVASSAMSLVCRHYVWTLLCKDLSRYRGGHSPRQDHLFLNGLCFLFLRYMMRIRHFRMDRLLAYILMATAVVIGMPLATAQSMPDLPPSSQKSMPAAPGTIYSLEQLIQLALESNPRVLAARDQAAASSGQLRAAKAVPNPQFEYNTGQQRSATGPLTTGNVSSWSVTQPLDMPYTRFPRVDAAEANTRGAQATRIAFEVEAIANVQMRYYELLRREAEARAANEDLDLTKQIRDRMQLRYDVGETARFELIRAQTEFLNAQMNAESSKLRIEQARGLLRQTVGHQLIADFALAAHSQKANELPPLETLLNEVRNQSPELQKAKAQVESTQSRLSFEKNSRLPNLAVKAQQLNDPNFTDRLYGLVVTIPIWDFRGGQIAEAEANASKARNDLNAQTQSLEQQMQSAYKLYLIASYQVQILDQEVVQLAGSARRIAEISYRFGERGMLEYLDAQRTFRAARNDLIKARFDLASIITEIQRLRASPEWVAKLEGDKK
jgi:cobalt-zinc-cadmium efflux system outer membrane protein